MTNIIEKLKKRNKELVDENERLNLELSERIEELEKSNFSELEEWILLINKIEVFFAVDNGKWKEIFNKLMNETVEEWRNGQKGEKLSDEQRDCIKIFLSSYINSKTSAYIEREENKEKTWKIAELSKKLDKYQKENENLRNLVANLEKVPAEQEAAQISWYKRKFPQEFAELERNLAGKDIFMSDFINLLTSKRKALGKKIRLSKRSLNNLQQSNDKFNQLLNQERYQTRQINVELQQEKTNYRDAVINLVKEKSQARKATVALKKRALELKNDLNSKRNEINNLKTKITTAEQDLGIGLNAEKEKERDEFESQLVHAQTESRNYKEQLEQQKDYQEVKQERDQLKTKLNQKEIEYNNSLQQKENQIITKIISELKLGLDKEANLEQVLDKVKELIINKNPETILHQQIAEKDKEIKKLREQNEKNYLPITRKQVEKKIKSLGIKSSIYEKKMLQLTSPQELENFYQEVINKEISKSREQERKVNNLNIVLWMLFIISLLSIILLVIKMKRNALLTQNKRIRGKLK